MVPLEVRPPRPVRVPLFATKFAPLAVKAVVPPGAMTMFPVVALPRVKVWKLVVPSVPVAFNVVAPVVPDEILATGVPELTFRKANFAEVVALAPNKRSSVCNLSKIAPLPSLNGEPPLETGRMPET